MELIICSIMREKCNFVFEFGKQTTVTHSTDCFIL